jgi:hypothetical protein
MDSVEPEKWWHGPNTAFRNSHQELANITLKYVFHRSALNPPTILHSSLSDANSVKFRPKPIFCIEPRPFNFEVPQSLKQHKTSLLPALSAVPDVFDEAWAEEALRIVGHPDNEYRAAQSFILIRDVIQAYGPRMVAVANPLLSMLIEAVFFFEEEGIVDQDSAKEVSSASNYLHTSETCLPSAARGASREANHLLALHLFSGSTLRVPFFCLARLLTDAMAAVQGNIDKIDKQIDHWNALRQSRSRVVNFCVNLRRSWVSYLFFIKWRGTARTYRRQTAARNRLVIKWSSGKLSLGNHLSRTDYLRFQFLRWKTVMLRQRINTARAQMLPLKAKLETEKIENDSLKDSVAEVYTLVQEKEAEVRAAMSEHKRLSLLHDELAEKEALIRTLSPVMVASHVLDLFKPSLEFLCQRLRACLPSVDSPSVLDMVTQKYYNNTKNKNLNK